MQPEGSNLNNYLYGYKLCIHTRALITLYVKNKQLILNISEALLLIKIINTKLRCNINAKNKQTPFFQVSFTLVLLMPVPAFIDNDFTSIPVCKRAVSNSFHFRAHIYNIYAQFQFGMEPIPHLSLWKRNYFRRLCKFWCRSHNSKNLKWTTFPRNANGHFGYLTVRLMGCRVFGNTSRWARGLKSDVFIQLTYL